MPHAWREDARRSGRAPGSAGTCLLLCMLLLGATFTARAFSVSVSEFHLDGVAGEVVESAFAVLNDEEESVDVRISIVDWEVDLLGVTQVRPPGTLTGSCAGWLAMAPEERVLAPAEEAEVSLTVRVLEKARGTRWCGLLIRVSPAGGPSSAVGLRVVRQFLVRVFVTTWPASADGQISGLWARGLNPLGVELQFENTGETHLRDVRALVVVEDTSGAPLAELAVLPFDVLPGYAVRRLVRWQWPLQRAGVYVIRVVCDFGAEQLVAGQIAFRLSELDLAPIGDSAAPPADLDGDGLYEDVNGDGRLDSLDPALLRISLGVPSVGRNARAFDFDNDGELTEADVACLEEQVLRTAE